MPLHVDSYELRKPRRTEEGFLKFEGVVATPGILVYWRDGETVREYVPPETLNDPVYLESLEGKPLVVEHPDPADDETELVTLANSQFLAVGTVYNVRWCNDIADWHSEDKGVVTEGIIRHPKGIAAYEGQGPYDAPKRQLSPAYDTTMHEESGVNEYGRYDVIQEERRAGNHVAMTSRGRDGKQSSIRTDAYYATDALTRQPYAPSTDPEDPSRDRPTGTGETRTDAMSLTEMVNARIAMLTTPDRPKTQIVQAIAESWGQPQSAVRSFLDRSRFKITTDLLSTLSSTLGIPEGNLRRAAEADRHELDPDSRGDSDMDTTTLRLDGVGEIEVPQRAAFAIKQWREDQEDELGELKEQIQELVRQRDEARAKLEELRNLVSETQTPTAGEGDTTEAEGPSGEGAAAQGDEMHGGEGGGTEMTEDMGAGKLMDGGRGDSTDGELHFDSREEWYEEMQRVEKTAAELNLDSDDIPKDIEEGMRTVVETWRGDSVEDLSGVEVRAKFDEIARLIDEQTTRRDSNRRRIEEGAGQRRDGGDESPTGRDAYVEKVMG